MPPIWSVTLRFRAKKEGCIVTPDLSYHARLWDYSPIILYQGAGFNRPKDNIYYWMAVTAYFDFTHVTLQARGVALNLARFCAFSLWP